jgi:hypothetical protein
MPNPSHTPGPWRASETYPPGDWCIHAAGIPWQLAYLKRHSKTEWPLEANAKLIAAAPELLDALSVIAGGDGDAQTIAQQTLQKLGLATTP